MKSDLFALYNPKRIFGCRHIRSGSKLILNCKFMQQTFLIIANCKWHLHFFAKFNYEEISKLVFAFFAVLLKVLSLWHVCNLTKCAISFIVRDCIRLTMTWVHLKCRKKGCRVANKIHTYIFVNDNAAKSTSKFRSNWVCKAKII